MFHLSSLKWVKMAPALAVALVSKTNCTFFDVNTQIWLRPSTDIRKLKLRLIKDGLTTPVFTAFTNMICKVAGKPPLSAESYCTDVQDVVEAQETLGMEAIIRGIHHVDWAHLLQKTWVPPAILPSGNRERRKDPLKQSVSFIRDVWDIFEEIWACRNGILYS